MNQARIVPTDISFVESFRECLDSVARERRFLAFVEAPPTEAVRGFVGMLVAGGGIQVLAIDPADRVIGWCDIMPNGREGFRHRGELGMGLLADARGKGLGAQLARAALERAWQAGLERVELEVFASNEAAIRLYKKLGFVTEGVKRDGRKLDGRYDDIVMMVLTRLSR